MSYTTSAMLSRGQSIVAIAGATGSLGQDIARVFLSPGFRPFFARVVCLTREPTAGAAAALAALGADVRCADAADPQTFVDALRGVDVVVDALGGRGAGAKGAADAKDALLVAAVQNAVKVYFPSEFGVDHRLNDFGDWDNHEWAKKRAHIARAKVLAAGRMKIISVYVGLFLQASIGPWFGFDTANKTFTVIGSPATRSTYTDKSDIGRALAQLSILSMSAATAATVPDHVRIGGTIKSFYEVGAAMEKESGATIEVVAVDLAKYRDDVREGYLAGKFQDPSRHIRILMGEGKLDFSTENDNELVNPREGVWKWKRMEEFANETEGKGSVYEGN